MQRNLLFWLRRGAGATTLSGFWIILATLLAAAPPPAAQAAVTARQATQQSAAPGATAMDARLERAAGAIDDGRFADALTLVDEAQAEAKLTAADADWASYLKARTLVGLGRGEEAEAMVRERHRSNPNGYTWASLVSILTTRGQYDKAASAILDLEEESLIYVNRLRPSVIENIVAALDGEGAKLRDQLIIRLVEGRYSGPTAQRVPDLLRLRYINLLLRQGRIEDAARQTDALESPAILSLLLADKSFEPMWEHPKLRALLAPGALVARVDRGVQARLESQALTSSDWLDVMRALRAIGRSGEAVRLGLHALEQARSEKRPAGPALRLEIASAYAEMGKAWEARRAAHELLREEVSAPVSLRIQIAAVLEVSGDDEGALLLLGSVGEASQSSSALRVAACAAHDLGRREKRDAALAALASVVGAAPSDALVAYVCVGEKDKAAEVLAGMFQRPELRAAAVLAAQLYADPLVPATDQSDMRYRMKALVASAAVQDAIKPYARTMALPFMMANARGN